MSSQNQHQRVPIYKLRTGIRKIANNPFAFAYFPSVLIFYEVNRQCRMSCSNLKILLRMRRTSNAIISCFNPLYVVGLIFYKVNRQCRMSCINLEILLRMRRTSNAIISFLILYMFSVWYFTKFAGPNVFASYKIKVFISKYYTLLLLIKPVSACCIYI